MKTTSIVTLGALLAFCALTYAQEEPKRPDGAQRKVPPAILEKFDTDKNGSLSEEERTAMRAELGERGEQFRAKMLEKFDTDQDGKLSDAEKIAMKEAAKSRREELLAKYDADKSGKLEQAEIQAARNAGEELAPRRPGEGKRNRPATE